MCTLHQTVSSNTQTGFFFFFFYQFVSNSIQIVPVCLSASCLGSRWTTRCPSPLCLLSPVCRCIQGWLFVPRVAEWSVAPMRLSALPLSHKHVQIYSLTTQLCHLFFPFFLMNLKVFLNYLQAMGLSRLWVQEKSQSENNWPHKSAEDLRLQSKYKK